MPKYTFGDIEVQAGYGAVSVTWGAEEIFFQPGDDAAPILDAIDSFGSDEDARIFFEPYFGIRKCAVLEIDGEAVLWIEGAEYVMRAPGGQEHRLLIAATSEERLRAHWNGFRGVRS